MAILSSIFNIFKKETEYSVRKGIYHNGEDNAYPERIDRLINNSVTSKRGAHIVSSFILGKGFDGHNDFIVNKTKNVSLFEFSKSFANDIARQGGVFVQVNYWADGQTKSLDVLPFNHCRVGHKDDNNYNGKIVVKDWMLDDKKSKPISIDVYNDDIEIIKSQINHNGIEKYKGQILFINPSGYIYPLSKLDPVMLDSDSENQVSIYKNISLRKGFFGKMIVITEPFVDGEATEEEMKTAPYRESVTARENFNKNIQEFMGAENADGVLTLEMPLVGEDLENTIKFKQIDSNIDDKLFAHTEDSVSNNISMAYSVPQGLIRPTESMFSQSAEALKEMKLSVQEETFYDRTLLEISVNKLLSNFKDFDGTDLKITTLVEQKTEKDADSKD